MRIGRLTLSDRASAGIYPDASGPEIERVVREILAADAEFLVRLLPDELDQIRDALVELADGQGCDLVITTGGTGPGFRDVTPEATRLVIDKELPGFGEIMRVSNFARVPTAILSRATAGIRGHCLLINLPGNPRSIGECLPLLRPAILECLSHIGLAKLEG